MATPPDAENTDNLRGRAEEALRKSAANVQQMPLEDLQTLVHELQVHQVELMMQNEELRGTQLELQDSRDSFTELYEFAPVGYLTLDREGIIRTANLTASTLFGLERSALIGTPVALHVADGDRNKFHQLCRNLRDSNGKQACELRILNKGELAWVQLEGRLRQSEPEQWLVTLSDIRLRKQAEAELTNLNQTLSQRVTEGLDRLSREQQRSEVLIENIVDGIITIDELGSIESVNPGAERIFGYRRDELLGQHFRTLMPARSRESEDAYLASFRNTGEKTFIGIGREVEGRRKDGTTFPMELAVSELQLDDRRLFAGTVRDVSKRKRSEEEQTSIGRILDDSLNEIFIFDAETLKFVLVNRGARENLGYTMDELRELTPVDIKPEHTNESFAELLAPLHSGEQERLVFETVHCRKDGTRYDVEVHVQVSTYRARTAFAAIIVDITDRKRVEGKLRVQQRAVEGAANGVLVTDATQMDNPIIYVNPAMQVITGYSADEVLGSNCRFLQNDDREQEALNVLRAAIQEERECKVVLRNYRKDGTPFWNELAVSPVRNAEGHVTNFVGIQSDITERKEAAEAVARLHDELEQRVEERTEQLREAQTQLVRKEKLATLGQLAGGVAHEIRNPMGVIRNAVYFLQQIQSEEDRDAKEALAEISRGLSNSERIVSELLDYASGPNVEASRFPLEEALNAALAMVTIPNSVRLERPAPFDTVVRADRDQTERLLVNLIQNAAQAMPDGGTLTVRCDAVDNNVITEVCDTGVGIAEDELEKIFEPLFTKRAKGIGLGLPLSRRYAELNDGSLTVQSTLGKGSTFRLTLPLPTTSGA